MIANVFRPIRGGKRARLYSARVQLPGWPKVRTIPLQVSDKRVAEQKLRELVQDGEREAAGILSPRLARDAARKLIVELLEGFLGDLAAKGRSINTLKAYRKCIVKLCGRCGWKYLVDVTPLSFTNWRAKNEVGPKMANDVLGYMNSLLNWLVRQKQLLVNPLDDVETVTVKQGRGYRRAFTVEELKRFLSVVPERRATVYLFAAYTGLRRAELSRLTWADFDLEAVPPVVRVPGTISKNRKSAVLEVHREAAAALRRFRPDLAMPYEWVFKGKVPNMDTFRRDLAAAKIPQFDEHGRRLDFHAFRTTFGTYLQASGVPMRAAMELMRHSDAKLTMRVYTDASVLPLSSELAKLPLLKVTPRNFAGDASEGDAQIDAQTEGFSGLKGAQGGASCLKLAKSVSSVSVSFRRKRAVPDSSSTARNLVDPIRFELNRTNPKASNGQQLTKGLAMVDAQINSHVEEKPLYEDQERGAFFERFEAVKPEQRRALLRMMWTRLDEESRSLLLEVSEVFCQETQCLGECPAVSQRVGLERTRLIKSDVVVSVGKGVAR